MRDDQFWFKKQLGQHFILNKKFIEQLLDFMQVEPNAIIIEIGIGPALLTSYLARAAKIVYGYEIDKRLEPYINENLKDSKNVKVIYDDFLSRDLGVDLSEVECDNLYCIGNLPYYITTPILMKIINSNLNFKKIVIMVQKEFGERMLAKPGTKDYNSLTVYLNYYYSINKLMNVNKRVFKPQPQVDSVLLELVPLKEPYRVIDEQLFFEIVKTSFRFKRKTLRNNLKAYNLDVIAGALAEDNLNLNIRAEKLTVIHFVKIANALKRSNNS